MAPKREGPFKIVKVLGPLTYKLELPESWRIHDTFHTTLLKPYVETGTHGPNYTRPPPEIESDEERYEVETILKHRRRGRGYQYYVKWKGYPILDALWEPSINLVGGADEILLDYRRRHHL